MAAQESALLVRGCASSKSRGSAPASPSFQPVRPFASFEQLPTIRTPASRLRRETPEKNGRSIRQSIRVPTHSIAPSCPLISPGCAELRRCCSVSNHGALSEGGVLARSTSMQLCRCQANTRHHIRALSDAGGRFAALGRAPAHQTLKYPSAPVAYSPMVRCHCSVHAFRFAG